jgi:hypothetical protein
MKAKSFSKEQIIERIKFDNPWWNTGVIEEFYRKMKHREYFKIFHPLITEKNIKRAVVLMGPRRVGKSVMLFQTIQYLIDNKIEPQKICYLSIETPIYNGIGLEELFKLCREALNEKSLKGFYIIFDEIQYLKNWEVHLKSMVDSYKETKFVVSGSAAAALRLKSLESGAGRFTEFMLPPLTFHEYIMLKDEGILDINKVLEDIDYDQFNKHFFDYINYGGYPEVTLSETIQQNPGRYIRNDIIDKVLLRDLPSLYGIDDVQELNSLFTYLAYNTGLEVSIDELSINSGVAKNTIKKYLTYLEAAFLIKIIHRIDSNAKKFKRANFFKVYLTNSSLRCALFSPVKQDDDHAGSLVETAIIDQWQHGNSPIYYARWPKGEVDMVILNHAQKPNELVEIKWSNRFFENPKELKSLKYFFELHKKSLSDKEVTVTTINRTAQVKENDMPVFFIPASIYCYVMGRVFTNRKSTEMSKMISEEIARSFPLA